MLFVRPARNDRGQRGIGPRTVALVIYQVLQGIVYEDGRNFLFGSRMVGRVRPRVAERIVNVGHVAVECDFFFHLTFGQQLAGSPVHRNRNDFQAGAGDILRQDFRFLTAPSAALNRVPHPILTVPFAAVRFSVIGLLDETSFVGMVQ